MRLPVARRAARERLGSPICRAPGLHCRTGARQPAPAELAPEAEVGWRPRPRAAAVPWAPSAVAAPRNHLGQQVAEGPLGRGARHTHRGRAARGEAGARHSHRGLVGLGAAVHTHRGRAVRAEVGARHTHPGQVAGAAVHTHRGQAARAEAGAVHTHRGQAARHTRRGAGVAPVRRPQLPAAAGVAPVRRPQLPAAAGAVARHSRAASPPQGPAAARHTRQQRLRAAAARRSAARRRRSRPGLRSPAGRS